jgi:hypothetical protein
MQKFIATPNPEWNNFEDNLSPEELYLPINLKGEKNEG